jgi:hypothetical protein
VAQRWERKIMLIMVCKLSRVHLDSESADIEDAAEDSA